ncbi:9e78d0f1-a6ba-4931-b726-3c660f0ab2c6 [Thermothielavioides terrestris]
MTKRK